MDTLLSILTTTGIIIGVILLFNLMIFIHELGHFWAARWRGLHVDRFQIWFGKPWWKKEVNGVQWGIGWIPAGGFVSLPQLAPMESIEGKADLPEGLKPVKPLDKLIVAAAGPVFSFLLAVVFAVAVWLIGKPVAESVGTTIGYVQAGSPAEKAGLKPGDTILEIDGAPVTKWVGNMEGVTELVMMGERDTVDFLVQRPGVEKPLLIKSGYKLPDKKWYERKAMRMVGIVKADPCVIGSVLPDSPAAKAGLKPGDKVKAVNGAPIMSVAAVREASKSGVPLEWTIERDSKEMSVQVTPVLPSNWKKGARDAQPIAGTLWASAFDRTQLEHPTPWQQVGVSLKWMGDTFQKIAAPKSDVGVEQLSGPVGIGSHLYRMFSSPDGWMMVLWFAVILNVNLAVLNILPLPVVDGGHVVLSLLEMIFKRPVGGVVLEYVQTGFVFVLMAFFLFVTFKDFGDLFGGGSKPSEELPPPVFRSADA